jgi:hypothetical protein
MTYLLMLTLVVCLHFLIIFRFELNKIVLSIIALTLILALLQWLSRPLGLYLLKNYGFFGLLVLAPAVGGAIEELLRTTLLASIYYVIIHKKKIIQMGFLEITVLFSTTHSLWECLIPLYRIVNVKLISSSSLMQLPLSPTQAKILEVGSHEAIMISFSFVLRLIVHILLLSLGSYYLWKRKIFFFFFIAFVHFSMNFSMGYASFSKINFFKRLDFILIQFLIIVSLLVLAKYTLFKDRTFLCMHNKINY